MKGLNHRVYDFVIVSYVLLLTCKQAYTPPIFASGVIRGEHAWLQDEKYFEE